MAVPVDIVVRHIRVIKKKIFASGNEFLTVDVLDEREKYVAGQQVKGGNQFLTVS